MLTKFSLLVCLLPFFALSQIKDSAAFFSDKPIYPYYLPMRPPGPQRDFKAVKELYHAKINAQHIASRFSGVITVLFFVNYQGEAGFFSIQAVDSNYSPVLIPQNINNPLWRLSDVILNTTQQYFESWTAGLDKEGQPVNTRKFYSFRFTNGVLSDIFPK